LVLAVKVDENLALHHLCRIYPHGWLAWGGGGDGWRTIHTKVASLQGIVDARLLLQRSPALGVLLLPGENPFPRGLISGLSLGRAPIRASEVVLLIGGCGLGRGHVGSAGHTTYLGDLSSRLLSSRYAGLDGRGDVAPELRGKV
jgi:hypothetical protein